MLREQLQTNLTQHHTTTATALFLMHVGDFQKPQRTNCDEETYETVYNLFETYSPLPYMVLPGDNDWIDCPDPTQALNRYRTTFVNVNRQRLPFPLDLTSPNPQYPELMVFDHVGVLFITVHLTDTKATQQQQSTQGEEWNTRMDANVRHVWDAVQNYQKQSIQRLRAVVLFGHGQYSTSGTREFFSKIQPLLDQIEIDNSFHIPPKLPVVYFHGDGHKFSLDDRASMSLDWSTFRDVQVDQGAFADVLYVQIGGTTMQSEQEQNNQHVLFDDSTNDDDGVLIQLDRQGGRYPERESRQRRTRRRRT